MLCHVLAPGPGAEEAPSLCGDRGLQAGNNDCMLLCFWQNKEYVCRGHDYERLEAFQQRMLSEFPQAVAMQHPNHPDDAILQCDAQCIFWHW